MSVWKVASINEEPEITLTDWCVWQLPNGDRHFNGWNVNGKEGRVSSAIVYFDPRSMTGKTTSGRIYKLSGPPRTSLDGLYVWNAWCNINSINLAEMVEIMDELNDGR
jgi:hypothetical protein